MAKRKATTAREASSGRAPRRWLYGRAAATAAVIGRIGTIHVTGLVVPSTWLALKADIESWQEVPEAQSRVLVIHFDEAVFALSVAAMTARPLPNPGSQIVVASEGNRAALNAYTLAEMSARRMALTVDLAGATVCANRQLAVQDHWDEQRAKVLARDAAAAERKAGAALAAREDLGLQMKLNAIVNGTRWAAN